MTTLTRADWEQRAQQLQIEGRAFIHGESTDAVSKATFDCISPVDGRLLGKVASCDLADAELAVADARATFESGVWSRMKPVERSHQGRACSGSRVTATSVVTLMPCLRMSSASSVNHCRFSCRQLSRSCSLLLINRIRSKSSMNTAICSAAPVASARAIARSIAGE